MKLPHDLMIIAILTLCMLIILISMEKAHSPLYRCLCGACHLFPNVSSIVDVEA
jgi:hypothetical protein